MSKVEGYLKFGASVLLVIVVYRVVFKSFLPTSITTYVGI